MAKVHVLSADGSNEGETDGESLWGNTFKLCRSLWFYAVLFNLSMGIVFIVMSAVYYDTCFEGPYPVRTVPAFMFLIGISQMALSVIIPSFKYFLKNIEMPEVLSLPEQDTKKTGVLFAGLVVAITGLFFTVFVILGLAFVSTDNTCHQALVLYAQITCSLYIFGIVALAVYLLVRRTMWPPLTVLSENGEVTGEAEPPPEGGEEVPSEEPPPFQDNLSEVAIPDGPKTMLSEESTTEYMVMRYICVVSGVLWLISAIPGIPILVFGSIYHDRCAGYRYIPIWFIVQGSILLFGAIFLVGGWCCGRGKSAQHRLLYLIPAAILIIFVIIWPIVGVAWSDQVRTSLVGSNDNIKSLGQVFKQDQCSREFVTGVLIGSALYAIPFFVLGFILCMVVICIIIALFIYVTMWIFFD